MKRSMLVIALAAACGGGGMDDDMTTDAGPDNEPLVNGKPASEYYAQFTHAMSNTDVSGAAAFPEQADGRNAFLVDFFLMPGGTLELFYSEGSGEVTATGHSLAIIGTSKKRRSGTWRVDGSQLVVDAYMRCDGFALNGQDALRCTLSQPIVTAAAQGRSGTFKKNAFGPTSPDDSEYADYVP